MTDILSRLFVRADWVTDAACRGMDPNIFNPPRGGTPKRTERAKAICATCPVQAECLQYALDSDEWTGIWGGVAIGEYRRRDMPYMKRKAPKKPRPAPGEPRPYRWVPIAHGTFAGYLAHKRRKVPPCDACRIARNDYRRARAAEGRVA